TPEAYIGLDYKNLRNREHPHSFSVLRAKFDEWFGQQADKAGAMVVPETVVERLIVKNNRVVGVATGRGDDLYCEVVVVCEGIGLARAWWRTPTTTGGRCRGSCGRMRSRLRARRSISWSRPGTKDESNGSPAG